MTAEQRLRQAAEAWFITEPLLFSVWVTHRLAERPGIHTVRVGEGRIEYNPEFIQSLPARALQELLRLEALRIVLKHPYSRRPGDPRRAYLASNITLREHVPTRLPLPSAREMFGDPSCDRQYFEFYYHRLAERDRGGGAGQAADTSVDTSAEATADATAAAPESGTGGATAAPAEGPAHHFSTALADENTQLWDEDSLQQEEINASIREAEQTDRWGSLPGSLRTHILASLKPKLDYRKVLRHFRTSILSSRRELTRMRPSRRYGFTYMGSRHRLRTRLLVAVDVSGSISDRDLAEAYSVINRLFKYGIESIDALQFDTQIQGPAETLRRQRQKVTVKGRGGTDFSPVMRYLDEHRQYDGLIVVTDGYAPRPVVPENRRTQVLWLFNSEAAYDRMRGNVGHIGRAVFIKSR